MDREKKEEENDKEKREKEMDTLKIDGNEDSWAMKISFKIDLLLNFLVRLIG